MFLFVLVEDSNPRELVVNVFHRYQAPVSGLVYAPFAGIRVQLAAVWAASGQSAWSEMPWRSGTDPSFAWTKASPSFAPRDLRALYNVTSGAGPRSLGSQAVVEFDWQFYSPSDQAAFYSTYGVHPKGMFDIVGYNNASVPGGEAMLDSECGMRLRLCRIWGLMHCRDQVDGGRRPHHRYDGVECL